MINDVRIKPLKAIPDERGFLYEMLRNDDDFYQEFGQLYLTAVYPGVVKGWHWHKLQTDHFICVKGMAKVVLYDRREESPTFGEVNEFFMGERNLILLVIPKGVLHGMKGVGTETAMIINVPTHSYNHDEPDEFRVDPHDNDVPYKWDQVDF